MKKVSMVLGVLFLAFSCKKDDNTGSVIVPDGTEPNSEWAIPVEQVRDGGVGRDGIKSIDAPLRVLATQASFLNDDDLVLGVVYNGKPVAYPHKILDYHEIVNDKIDDFAFSISYCPLTGTGVLYDRTIDGKETTFGVSGLLYNSNLILYDRESSSLWSQMLLKSVNGVQLNANAPFYQLIETTFGTWKNWYPGTEVFTVDLRIAPNYDQYPYGDYKTNNDYLLFSVPIELKTIPNKERVLGVKVGEQVTYYRFRTFGQLNSYVTKEFNGEELLVFGSEKDNYMMAYFTKTTDGEKVSVRESLLGIEEGGLFMDTSGTKWDIFGVAYEGPGKGDQLVIPTNFIGYAFAWAAFYPNDFVTFQ